MKINVCLILVFLASLASAQQIRLQGTVVDGQTNQPIAAATISVTDKRLFYPTDKRGCFFIADYNINNSDTLAFSCLGYKTVRIPFRNVTSHIVVKLYPQVNELSEVTIRSNSILLIKIGSKEKNSKLSVWQHTGEDKVAFMDGSKNVKGIIKTVGYYLSNGRGKQSGGNVAAPFRIRLFQVDSIGKPGKEISKDIIIVSAKKDNAWFDADISAYHIKNPDSGFFASFTLLTVDYYQFKKNARTTDALGNKWITIDSSGVGHDLGAENPSDIITPRLGVITLKANQPRSYFSVDSLQDMSWHFEPEYNNWEYMIRATILPE